MDGLFGGVDGVVVFQDDILIATATEEEHLAVLERVFDILNSNNLRFSKNKCEILTDKLEFLGHTLSSKGISPIESKVKALIDTPIPGNVKILHSFLGLVNYYAKFLPHLSERIRPLFSLIRKGSKWLWCEEYTKIMEQIELELSYRPILEIFTEAKPQYFTPMLLQQGWTLCCRRGITMAMSTQSII